MGFPRQTILDLCLKYGGQVHLPPGIDGARLMYAIACNESSCGANCTPRHEPAYDRGGSLSQGGNMPQLLILFGAAAACSYGPWQIMLTNAGHWTPDELTADPEKCAEAYVAYMNRFVIGFRKAATVEQIAETYNSGRFGNDLGRGVLKYAADAADHYLSAPICLPEANPPAGNP